MLFRTYEHYPPDEVYYNIVFDNFDNNYDNICIICFDTNSLFNELISLNAQTLYIKKCECNAIIHNHCLSTWHAHTRKCPICRSDMITKAETINKITLFTIKCVKTLLIVFYVLSLAHLLYLAYCSCLFYFF